MAALHRLIRGTSSQMNVSMKSQVLLLAEPNSLGLPSLDNVQIEIDQVKSLIPPAYTVNINSSEGTMVVDILESVQNSNVLHLACHGHQDQENPLNSGFDLKGGRLTLGQLMRLKTPEAQLAYLSACDSASMDESRPDEGLNLVGAMIFVGFKSVIGTMWCVVPFTRLEKLLIHGL
jgi:CHAT domain-containing protein